MATFTAEAVAEGDVTSWSLGAGSDKVSAVLLPDDEDTSYIDGASGAGTQTFNHNADSLPFINVSGNPTVHVRARLSSGPVVRTLVRLSGSNTVSGDHAVSASYQDFSDALARPGGGSWNDDDIRASQFGLNDPALAGIRCTTNYMTFTADLASAGFVSLVLSLSGFIGSGIGLEHMAALAAAVRMRTGTLITPAEYRRALDHLRGWRRRVWAY